MLLMHIKEYFGSNYGNIFHKFHVCCDISEKKGLMLFIFGAVINHNEDLMHVKIYLGSVPISSIHVHYFIKVCSDISEISVELTLFDFRGAHLV